MSKKIVQFKEEVIKGKIKELVRGSVEETLNGLLEAEAEKLTQAGSLRTKRRAAGIPQRSLQPKPDNKIRRRQTPGPAAEGDHL